MYSRVYASYMYEIGSWRLVLGLAFDEITRVVRIVKHGLNWNPNTKFIY